MKWSRERVIEELLLLERKLKRRPVKRDNSNLYFLSRKYFGSWNNLMEATNHKIKRKQEVRIPKTNLNHFYYFLGLLSTDGHIYYDLIGGRYKVMLFTSYIKEKDMLVNLIENLFAYKPSIRTKKYSFNKTENYEIYISSKNLCDFLINEIKIPKGAKSLNIRIPKFIFESNKNKIWHFIRGVFDGDGSIIKTSKAKALKIPSGSEKFVGDMGDLLISLGIKSFKIRKEREKLWLLKINKVEDIKKIYPLIYKNSKGYFYQRKEKKWKQYI